MTRFPTAGHLASWAGLAPAARQSGPRNRKPAERAGRRLPQGPLHPGRAAPRRPTPSSASGSAACPANSAAPAPGAPSRRSILVIIWHLLADPEARFADLGPDWHQRKTDRDRKTRNHLRGLQPLGYDVTITPAA